MSRHIESVESVYGGVRGRLPEAEMDNEALGVRFDGLLSRVLSYAEPISQIDDRLPSNFETERVDIIENGKISGLQIYAFNPSPPLADAEFKPVYYPSILAKRFLNAGETDNSQKKLSWVYLTKKSLNESSADFDEETSTALLEYLENFASLRNRQG